MKPVPSNGLRQCIRDAFNQHGWETKIPEIQAILASNGVIVSRQQIGVERFNHRHAPSMPNEVKIVKALNRRFKGRLDEIVNTIDKIGGIHKIRLILNDVIAQSR